MNGNEACQAATQSTTDVFVGIDVSKLKLDVARLRLGKVRNKVFSNDRTGFRALAAWLSEDSITPAQAHLCMEATGPYSEEGRTLVSKRGHAGLRKALYMPGMVAIRYNPLVKDMAQRLKAKGMMPRQCTS